MLFMFQVSNFAVSSCLMGWSAGSGYTHSLSAGLLVIFSEIFSVTENFDFSVMSSDKFEKPYHVMSVNSSF